MNHRSLFPRTAALPVGCVAAMVTAGCYTTTNVVTMDQLHTKYPVSASGQYVDSDGAIVTENQYDVVKPFEFDRSVEAPRHEDTETALKLEPELDPIVAQSQGDAVTDMKVYAAEYDTGSHGSSAGWKILGWTFGLSGATLAVTGAAIGDDASGPLITVGAIFAGIGVGSYLIGTACNDPAVWKLHVTGNIVKRNASAGPPRADAAQNAPLAPTTTPAAPAQPTPEALPSPQAAPAQPATAPATP